MPRGIAAFGLLAVAAAHFVTPHHCHYRYPIRCCYCCYYFYHQRSCYSWWMVGFKKPKTKKRMPVESNPNSARTKATTPWTKTFRRARCFSRTLRARSRCEYKGSSPGSSTLSRSPPPLPSLPHPPHTHMRTLAHTFGLRNAHMHASFTQTTLRVIL